MIPTSVTNSPPAAGLAQNGAAAVVVVVGGGGGGGGGSAAAAAAAASTAAAAAQQQSNYNSIVLGLASLILEGRPIADDEYPLQLQLHAQQQQQQQQPQLHQQQQLASSSSSGRHSPRPSTSRAAINITTNPYALASPTLRSAYGHAYAHTPAPAYAHAHGHAYVHSQTQGYGYDYRQGANSSSSSSSTSATHQRWTQKLCQLRQLSPAAQSMTVEPELVSLAINELNTERGDFEIVRRVMFNNHLTTAAAAGGGGGGGGSTGIEAGGTAGSSTGAQLLTVASSSNSSAASSPGGSVSSSDNILHSLQSLATTCLRGGGAPNTGSSSSEARPLSLDIGFGAATAAAAAAATTVSQTASRLSDYNCSRTTMGGGARGVEGGAGGLGMSGGVYGGGVGVGGGAATSTATASNNIATGSGNGNATTTNSSCNTRPKHGPHCDQFLRKMGLAKGESADAEEHFCDMSYVNITCSRWRAHCMKMEAILARREPVCIEVFLGPAGHKILLEQWIISAKEKVPPPTMTLPSLCSAIRSQLYFSQIVAWCDLLRKCDPSVYDSGRVIFASGSSTTAGDLAGHSGGGSSSNTTTTSSTAAAAAAAASTAAGSRRPRLNIFYRIRPYDPTSSTNGNHNDGGFSAKATVHNFPHVNIAENFSVAVCVKSLPRFNGGLPHISPPAPRRAPPPPPPATSSMAMASSKSRPAASTPTGGGGMCAATPTGLGARIALLSTTPPGTSSSSCDKYERRRRGEEQLELYADADAEPGAPADELDGHRERQLQKYRKRIQRRDKKRERKPSDDPLEEQMDAMDEGNDEDAGKQPQSPAAVLIPTLMSPPRRIAMISTGTQTSLSSCQKCGCEKTLLCLNCTADGEDDADDADAHGNGDGDGRDDTSASEMEETSISSSCSLSSSDLIVGTPRNKAELLLQSIQRTPKNRKPNPKVAHNDLKSGGLLQTPTPSQQQQSPGNSQPKPAAPTSGCQMCKRQKTQHTFASGKKSGGAVGVSGAAGSVGAVVTAGQESKSATNGTNGHSNSATDSPLSAAGDDNSMDQEVEQTASTKLTPNIDRCTLNAGQERCQTPPDVGACAMDDERIVVQFKTPISHVPLKQHDYQQQQQPQQSQQQQQQQQLGQQLSKAPSQLRLNCNGIMLDRETPSPMLSPLVRKALPKVNLNTIFCSSGNSPSTTSSSAPISIDSGLAFSFEQPSLSYAHTQSQSQSLLTPPDCHQSTSNLHVQKSYSAPTLPNALSVSPRFAKQAAFYKRRSRHLSDRSDRSSLGSDEQLSDEDLESGMCSPAGSPLKTRARLATQFGGRPLLGNLEESLLQKRLLPKIEVAGFRLQLGASGVFCPKQRTISASSYFYELHGETLSTPYLCEIRLPRKGYSVPLMGTVQATLLNPMGTVVRMFVIPYDMRDMPNLHRTFIRQRILAEELPCNSGVIMQQPEREREREPGSPTAKSTTSKLGHFISAEQMKRLRYSIHLRFQTSRSGRLSLHTDIRLLISRRTDCDTAAAHAKGLVEAPNELVTDTLMPTEPRYSARQESPGKI